MTSDAAGRPAVRFPDGFLWGSATAAYQIEGAHDVDGRKPSIWDTFSHTPGKTTHGDTGDIADDHFHRFREDVAIMADLGLQSYRFSIAWPRIVPDGRGAANSKGLDFYKRLADELRTKGIVPWVTLYHWDLPQSLEDAGGWPARATAEAFIEYATTTFTALKDHIDWWTTLNEPWCSAFLGYASGAHAPGRTGNGADAFRAAHHLLLAHGDAVAAMRAIDDTKSFGITLNLHAINAATQSAEDVAGARLLDGQQNRLWFDPLLLGTYPDDMREQADRLCAGDVAWLREGDLERIAQPLDALGVNYYMRHTVSADEPRLPRMAAHPEVPGGFADLGKARTAMNWQIDPDGLLDSLTRLHKDYPPIPLYVTENGAAFHDYVSPDGLVHDPERIDYLDGHFRAAADAIAAGVDLRGYFVWSLLDNFEWGFGFSRRFGLTWIDYGTQRRTVKDSGHWLKEVILRNGL